MMTISTDPMLQGGGQCGAILRSIDWAKNPLGTPASWTAELRTVVGIALASSQPMLIVWGPKQITLYNDGYALMCGDRHPAALGRPFHDLWFDIWDTVEPIITAAYNGTSTSMDDIQFTMHRNGYPEETHFAFSYNPVRGGDGEVLGMLCPCTETTVAVEQRQQQMVERRGFLQIFEVALGAIAVLEGPEHVFRYVNGDYQALIGNRDVIGRPIRAALREVVEQGFADLLDQVYSGGQTHIGRSVVVDLERKPGQASERRLLDFLYHPLRDDAGEVNGIFVQALDVTSQVEAESQQQLLNRELGHRIKNQMALVQAIVNQTLRSARDIPSARRVLNDRIAILSKAHELLTRGNVIHTTVAEIVREALALHDDREQGRFAIAGPDLPIAARPALSLSLILHELATNAAKYGALSVPQGRVTIRWLIDGNIPEIQRFILSWSEQGGPAVRPPDQTGLGTRLISAGLSGTDGSSVSLRYLPEGVQCDVIADAVSLQAD